MTEFSFMDYSNESNTDIAGLSDQSSGTSECIDIEEWDDIHRAILEQNVRPGTKAFQYKGRFVPLYWEPKPLQSVILSFGEHFVLFIILRY